jgi:hypothetical protein
MVNSTKTDPQRLISEVQLFRVRVATAEAELKLLREHARETKRRRKEAKRIAQRARRQFKRFKAELVELKRALAKAEGRLCKEGGGALAEKVRRPGLSPKAMTGRGKRRSRGYGGSTPLRFLRANGARVFNSRVYEKRVANNR